MAHSLAAAFAAKGFAPPTPERRQTLYAAQSGSGVVDQSVRPGGNTRRPPGWLVEGQVGISRHAIERYRERFTPDADYAAAQDGLFRRVHRDGDVVFVRDKPRWLVSVPSVRRPGAGKTLGYLIVDDELVLPLRETRYRPDRENGHMPFQRFYVVTCLWRLHLDGERIG